MAADIQLRKPVAVVAALLAVTSVGLAEGTPATVAEAVAPGLVAMVEQAATAAAEAVAPLVRGKKAPFEAATAGQAPVIQP